MPCGQTHTFWGPGLSQGHSNAIRSIKGVKYAVQYTLPKDEALKQVRLGSSALTKQQKHIRECFVVADQVDEQRIEQEIKTMPVYFEGYETTVHFITEQEFRDNHDGRLGHGGFVLGSDGKSVAEFGLKLQSNPFFTASVMIAYARALIKLKSQDFKGALTVLDIAPGLLTKKDRIEAVSDFV